MPATPLSITLSLVRVPVLSKQQVSTLPTSGMRNGSVQKIATDCSAAKLCVYRNNNSRCANNGAVVRAYKPHEVTECEHARSSTLLQLITMHTQ
jgi:hypothetical protein